MPCARGMYGDPEVPQPHPRHNLEASKISILGVRESALLGLLRLPVSALLMLDPPLALLLALLLMPLLLASLLLHVLLLVLLLAASASQPASRHLHC